MRRCTPLRIPFGYETMHLDTVCTQIDYDKFTVYPGMYDELHAYRLRKGDNPGRDRRGRAGRLAQGHPADGDGRR